MNSGENIHVIDSFLPEEVYARLRTHADGLAFDGVRNPVDGVVYPGISTDIPDEVRSWVRIMAGADIKMLFMRLSLAGVPVPHQAHTDSVMGRTSLMLYLNRVEHCQGGTQLVFHRQTGMLADPRDERELKAWQEDTNKPEAWAVYEQADMKPNRAFIFPARLMHRAAPIGGFGADATNGRLVLTAFF